MSDTVGDFMFHRLTQWGISRTYGYPGDGINGLMGASRRLWAGEPWSSCVGPAGSFTTGRCRTRTRGGEEFGENLDRVRGADCHPARERGEDIRPDVMTTLAFAPEISGYVNWH